jgi:hypothetical protein
MSDKCYNWKAEEAMNDVPMVGIMHGIDVSYGMASILYISRYHHITGIVIRITERMR